MTGRPPLFSIGLLSAGLLAYEICLMHLFAIIQYHHFAYMIISLALLGFGSSGTFLTLFRERIDGRYTGFYVGCTVLFAIAAPFAFFAAQTVPFNGLELFWDIRQSLYLGLLFLLLFLPFFFGAAAIGASFIAYPRAVAVVYGGDLVGAGLGSILILGLFWVVPPATLLLVISGLGFAAAALALVELSTNRLALKVCGLLALFVLLAGVGQRYGLQPTPYKPLQQYLRLAGTMVVAERTSPLGLVQVLESPRVPLRYAPGMSLLSGQEPLEQLGVFINGDGLSVITRKPDEKEQLNYLQQMTSALPYYLGKPENVLILGIGGGQDILQAGYHEPGSITAVELNPQLVELLTGPYRAYSGNLLSGNTRVYLGDMRGFLERNRTHFDLIQVALVDSYFPSASGLYALRENYLYTVEALGEYLRHLSPRGYLAITRWVKNPPRDSLKLLATAVAALHQRGIADAGSHLALIRGWQTSTLIVKASAFTPAEHAEIQAFCRERAFDIVYFSTGGEELANRYNILPDNTFSQAARTLVEGDATELLVRYKYNLEPATDDRPYFHHFFKWSALAEFFRLRDSGGAALLESGYLILLTVLVVAMVLSFLLILGPLAGLRQSPGRGNGGGSSRARVIIYFFAVGIAFLLVEIACIQKSVLFLHHPVYAVSTVIAAFLVFGGLGSLRAQRLATHPAPEKILGRIIAAIVLICLGYLLFLGKIFALAGELSLAGRLALTVLCLGPLAFFMGMPFALALSRLAEDQVAMVPWAWGINGCGSVISSMLATLLAIHFGFNAVLLVAILLYLVIACCFPVRVSAAPQP